MGVTVRRRHCRTCDQKRPFERHSPNWILHLLLVLLTAGLWMIVLGLILFTHVLTPHRCRVCGQARYL